MPQPHMSGRPGHRSGFRQGRTIRVVPDEVRQDAVKGANAASGPADETRGNPPSVPARKYPEFVPVPADGWLARRYRWNKRRGNEMKVPHLQNDFVTPTWWAKRLDSWLGHKLELAPAPEMPQLSKKEHAAFVAEQDRLDAIWQQAVQAYYASRLDRTIIALSDRVGAQRVCIINTKGSSARTTTLAHMASEHGITTLAGVTAVDFNLASGNLGRRLGRDFGQTLPLSLLIDEHINVDQYREFMRPIRPTPYNVRVVSADNIIKAGKKPNEIDAVKSMEALYRFCDFLHIDTLNLITEPVALANVDFSDVIVFVANVGEHESLRQLGSSMETLREQGFRDKVNRSVVAISNIPEGHNAMEYQDYLHDVNDENQVVSQTGAEFKGKIVGIPHDPYLKLVRQVDLEALQYETRMAYKRLVIAALQQNPRFWNDPSQAVVELKDDGEPEREIFKGFDYVTPPSH